MNHSDLYGSKAAETKPVLNELGWISCIMVKIPVFHSERAGLDSWHCSCCCRLGEAALVAYFDGALPALAPWPRGCLGSESVDTNVL